MTGQEMLEALENLDPAYIEAAAAAPRGKKMHSLPTKNETPKGICARIKEQLSLGKGGILMGNNFGKQSGRKIALVSLAVLLCCCLSAVLTNWYVQANESDPVPPPEGSCYWIKDSDATIIINDGEVIAKFGKHSVNLSDLDWYHITYPEEPNQFLKDKIALYPNATRIKYCHYYRANVLQDYTTFEEWKDKDFIFRVSIWTDGQLKNGENTNDDSIAHGLFLLYYVARERRVYNVRTLLTDEQFAIITQKATPHIYDYDALTESLWLKMPDSWITGMGTWEERKNAVTDNYVWPIGLFSGL